MRIIWISPIPAFPATNSDRIWLHSLASQLMNEGHEIYFIYCGPELAIENTREMKNFFNKYLYVPAYGNDAEIPVDLERIKIAVQLLADKNGGYLFYSPLFMGAIINNVHRAWIKVLIPFLMSIGETSDFLFYKQQQQLEKLFAENTIGLKKEKKLPYLEDADVVVVRCEEEKRFIEDINPNKLILLYSNSATSSNEHYNDIKSFCRALERKKKRILIIMDYPFWMVRYGGHAPGFIVMANYLKKRYSLEIFFHGFYFEWETEQAAKIGLAENVRGISHYEADWSIPEASENGFIPEPILHHYKSSSYRSFSRFIKEQAPYDAIIIFTIFDFYFIRALPYKTLTILDTHDCWSRRNYIYNGKEESLLTAAQEMEVFSKFGSIIMVEESETIHAQKMLPEKISICCPFTFPVGELPFPKNGIHFGFIAPAHILEPIEWFMNEIWIFQDRPDAKLHIFGTVCERIKNCPPNVMLHGIVQSEEVIHSYCNIMLNPAFIATGISTKSVMSLAYGRPLIATSVGARGITSTTGKGVYVANTRAEFIKAMQLFSHDRAMWHKFSQDALKFSREFFTVEKAYEPLSQIIENY